MPRQYAIGKIPGLAGQVTTHSEGEVIKPGEALPEGATEFTLTYWYNPTPADIEAGANPDKRVNVAIPGVSTNASAAEIRRAIMKERAARREENDWTLHYPLE